MLQQIRTACFHNCDRNRERKYQSYRDVSTAAAEVLPTFRLKAPNGFVIPAVRPILLAGSRFQRCKFFWYRYSENQSSTELLFYSCAWHSGSSRTTHRERLRFQSS